MSLYITEFVGPAVLKGGGPIEPPVAEQKIAMGATSVALNAKTTLVRLHSDTTISFAVGVGATASAATNRRLVASITEWVSVPENSGYVIATVVNT